MTSGQDFQELGDWLEIDDAPSVWEADESDWDAWIDLGEAGA